MAETNIGACECCGAETPNDCDNCFSTEPSEVSLDIKTWSSTFTSGTFNACSCPGMTGVYDISVSSVGTHEWEGGYDSFLGTCLSRDFYQRLFARVECDGNEPAHYRAYAEMEIYSVPSGGGAETVMQRYAWYVDDDGTNWLDCPVSLPVGPDTTDTPEAGFGGGSGAFPYMCYTGLGADPNPTAQVTLS